MAKKKSTKASTSDDKASSLNSKVALVMGLASIGCMWIYGITGMAVAYLTLRYADKAVAEYKSSAGKYGRKTVGNIKKARIFAYLGMLLGGSFFLMCLTKWILTLM
jgi:hypothetical protein